jgi:restriction system protein
MAIPDFQTIMLPLLQSIADGKDYRLSELIDRLAIHFKLTDLERIEMLPSGKQPRFDNRVGWACTHLKKALVLDSPSRGIYRIGQRGLDLLNSKPDRIDVNLLDRFPEHKQFRNSKSNFDSRNSIDSIDAEKTPDELMAEIERQLREDLAQEIIEKLKTSPPSFFEHFVIELLVKMGYGGSLADAGKAIGKTGDEGIDGIIKEDRLGLDVIYIQAKRWENTVGRPDIQQFVGALVGKRAQKGIFITTSKFSEQARSYLPADMKVVLIDGMQLANYAIEFNLGVSIVAEYQVKRLDLDYFEGLSAIP